PPRVRARPTGTAPQMRPSEVSRATAQRVGPWDSIRSEGDEMDAPPADASYRARTGVLWPRSAVVIGAEVFAGKGLAGGEEEVVEMAGGGGGDAPAGQHRESHGVGAGEETGESIGAAGAGGRRDFAGVEDAVVVGVDEDAPAGDARLVRIFHSV